MQIPFVDLKLEYQNYKEELTKAVLDVIESGSFILGKNVTNFEDNITRYLGQMSIGCASGTDALLMALMTLNIGPGDEVITTPFTFFATAGAVARVGAKPVFVDIESSTFNLNVNSIESKITEKTKAILPVHLFGRPMDMAPLLELSQKHNLYIIEDACQAIGADYKGKKVGSIGDIGCFSFFPTKNLGGFGDGGLICCRDETHYEYLKKLRVHGSAKKYLHEFVGINSRLDALQAAVLEVKLKYIDDRNKKRRLIAQKYNNAFKDVMIVPADCEFGTHIYHQYALLTNRRDELLNYLTKQDIAAGIYYPLPLHLQESFKYLGNKPGDCPISEKVSKEIISLPIYPEMSDEQVNFIIDSIKKFFR